MKQYDYRAHMIEDIKNYIIEQELDWRNEPYLYDTLWEEDKITGNNHAFYDTEENCREYVATNLDIYFDAARRFDCFPNGYTAWTYTNPAQHMDTTIRCYLLDECLEKAIEELENGT